MEMVVKSSSVGISIRRISYNVDAIGVWERLYGRVVNGCAHAYSLCLTTVHGLEYRHVRKLPMTISLTTHYCLLTVLPRSEEK